MDNLGEIIRKLREEKRLPLRTVAAYLDIDQAILSKIERGQRRATRLQVIKLAEYFGVSETDLLISWLSDKLLYEIVDEQVALKVLQVAEEKISYLNFQKINREEIKNLLIAGVRNFASIKKAWIFGSFARKNDGPASDIDIALQTDDSFSYFDLAEVQYRLEKAVNRKVDVGFIDSFKPYILEHIKPDLNLIYERPA
jgi:predicted nucleotidyltransferase/plasmid maintenance system antidote protein VapI